jgi:UDP-glucose 4-epimerase
VRKILITGAAGFIGSQLAYALWKQKETVVLLDDFSYGKEDNLVFEDHNFCSEIIRQDICEKERLYELFEREQFDVVYHIAAITPLPDCQLHPGRAMEVNVAGTANVLEAARIYGVGQVIFASTSAVYENCGQFPTREADVQPPTLVYSSGKYFAEQLCRSYTKVYGMNIVVLRFANVYGPHIDCLRTQPPVAGYLVRELYHNRVPVLHGDGEQRRDFIYVDDLVDLAIRVQKHRGFDCVNVSSNTTHSINEMYDRIAAEMKKQIQPDYQKPDHYWVRYPKLYEGAYPISAEVLAHEVQKYTLCDNIHAKEAYGWEPKIGFEEGLKRTVAFAVKAISGQTDVSN